MSFFEAPVSPVRDERSGRVLAPASLVPAVSLEMEQVYQLIVGNEQLRRDTLLLREAVERGDAAAAKLLKMQRLPFVTPYGTFSRRQCGCLLQPSGLVVVDVDHLASLAAAEELRDALFDDAFLRPELAFVSPGGRGVKLFVPAGTAAPRLPEGEAAGQPSSSSSFSEVSPALWAMYYVELMYAERWQRRAGAGVDRSGKDIVRTCFLCHDAGARRRGQ